MNHRCVVRGILVFAIGLVTFTSILFSSITTTTHLHSSTQHHHDTQPLEISPLQSSLSRYWKVSSQQQQHQESNPHPDDDNGDTILGFDDEEASLCLTPNCLQQAGALLARAYHKTDTNKKEWVVHDKKPDFGNYTSGGILLVKNFKAASSTAAGIADRLAVRHASSDGKAAAVRNAHSRAWHYQDFHPTRTLLFTSVRDPAKRAVSRIFYTAISQKKEQPTDENILSKLHWTNLQYGAISHDGGGYQVRYLSMNKKLALSWNETTPTLVVNPKQVQDYVAAIINVYDFILVAERMEESVVAFSMVLNVSLADVLVQDSKVGASGKWVFLQSHHGKKGKQVKCAPSIPSFQSAAVKEHLQSKEWYAKNYGDYLLHAAAHASLNQTIAQLDPAVFQIRLERYKQLKATARVMCAKETIGHCSANGTIQTELSRDNCYSDDNGCGFACIDRMLREGDDNKRKST